MCQVEFGFSQFQNPSAFIPHEIFLHLLVTVPDQDRPGYEKNLADLLRLGKNTGVNKVS
jgi:hypothetical protein